MSTPSPMRTLVAVDGSRGSMTTAREVARRPWPPQSLIRILYVNEHGPEPEPATEYPWVRQGLPPSLRDAAGHALEKAAAPFDAASRADVSVQAAGAVPPMPSWPRRRHGMRT